MRSFHIQLPEKTYAELCAEAERSCRSATALARHAIEAWLGYRRKLARDQAIAAFAAEHAGTDLDLDRDLEAASIKCLLESEGEPD